MSAAEHAGCIPGQCRAGNQWRATGCGAEVDGATWGGGPSAEGALTEAERETLDAILIALWQCGTASGYEHMRLKVETTVERILAARSQRPEVAEYVEGSVNHHVQPLIGWLRLMEADDKSLPAEEMGRFIERLYAACEVEKAWLAAQRPEGVTVTEWGVQFDTGDVFDTQSERVARELAAFNEADRAVTRQRTTFPDVVTEWAEVSGDTEAGGVA